MLIHVAGGPGRQPNILFAIFMVVAGILLFLGNLGWLPIRNVWDYWPVIFVAMGCARIAERRSRGAPVVGGMLILLGTVGTLLNTGVLRLRFHDDSWPVSLVLLGLGVAGLAKAVDGGKRRGRTVKETFMAASGMAAAWENPGAPPTPSDSWSKETFADTSSTIENFAFWSSVKRKVESSGLQGGSLTSFMANIEIDLRRSRLAEGSSAAIDANAVMGSIKLRIPEAWRVIWNGAQIMGNFQDNTVPQVIPGVAPQLVVTGFVFMGNIEIES